MKQEIMEESALDKADNATGKDAKNRVSVDEADEMYAQLVEQYKERKSVKGWKNFPGLCLRILDECPYVYDAMKLDVLRWEASSGNHRYIK